MALFGKKKKETKTCSCNGNCNTEAVQKNNASASEDSSIKVLGSGCAKCNQLEAAVKEALSDLGLNTPVEHVTDFAKIAAYGVMSTPALVVNGKVTSYGKVLKKDEAIDILKKELLS